MALLSIDFLSFVAMVAEYATSYIGWKFFYSNTNITLIALCLNENRKHVEGLVYVMNSTLGMVPFAAVIVFTTALLRRTPMWRMTTSQTA